MKEIKENAIQAHIPAADFMDELAGTKVNTAGAERIVQENMKDLLKRITSCVELTGFINPMNKVYELNKPLFQLPLCFALLTIYSYDKLYFNTHASSLMQRDDKASKIDGPAFITGMITVFKQFHPSNERIYI